MSEKRSSDSSSDEEESGMSAAKRSAIARMIDDAEKKLVKKMKKFEKMEKPTADEFEKLCDELDELREVGEPNLQMTDTLEATIARFDPSELKKLERAFANNDSIMNGLDEGFVTIISRCSRFLKPLQLKALKKTINIHKALEEIGHHSNMSWDTFVAVVTTIREASLE